MRKKWLIAGAIALLAAGALSFFAYCSYTKVSGVRTCSKCYLHHDYAYHEILGVKFDSHDDDQYSDLPILRARQTGCHHVWFGSESRTTSSRCSIACRPGARPDELFKGGGWSIIVAHVVDKLEYWEDDAWFIQQATGEDFGITYNEANRTPLIPAGAREKVLEWWRKNRERLANQPTPRKTATTSPSQT